MFGGELIGKSNSTLGSLSTPVLPLCCVFLIAAAINASAVAQSAGQAPANLDINVTRIISPISPTLYGLMTEEINHSYEGGLYAEIIQNRAFHADWEGTPPWDLVRRGNAVAGQDT
jgi:alpha-N-arabinofuranosidase